MTLLVGLDVLGQGVRDVAIRDGVIVEPDGSEVRVDCTGLVALPALVDPHTHLRDPGPGTAETIASNWSSLIGRFQQAFSSPRLILSRSNGTRAPSFLMTLTAGSSIFS